MMRKGQFLICLWFICDFSLGGSGSFASQGVVMILHGSTSRRSKPGWPAFSFVAAMSSSGVLGWCSGIGKAAGRCVEAHLLLQARLADPLAVVEFDE